MRQPIPVTGIQLAPRAASGAGISLTIAQLLQLAGPRFAALGILAAKFATAMKGDGWRSAVLEVFTSGG